MRENRIYRQGALTPGQVLQLEKEEAHHLINVLRVRAGQEFLLFNGEGPEYRCRILSVEKRRLTAEVMDEAHPHRESPLKITLLQGIAKTQHMDLALQKATELGVTAIQPLLTERCAIKQGRQQLDKKESHWLGVITSACEQSGRTILPELHTTSSLDQYLSQQGKNIQRLTLSPGASRHIRDIEISAEWPVEILIGPEGGLSEREVDQCSQHGFVPVNMGPRILRTETASIAIITLLQGLWGDLS